MPEPPPLPDPLTISRAGRVRKLPGHLRNMQPSSLTCLPAHLRPPAPPAPARRQPSPETARSRPASPPPGLPLDDLVARPQDEDAMSSKSSADIIRTRPNEYGLYRVYTVRPQRDPEGDVSIEAAFDPTAFPKPAGAPNIPHGLERLLQPPPKPEPPPFAPFANVSIFTVLYWQACGDSNLKSYSQIDLLARLMQEPGFDPKDLVILDSAREERRLDNYFEDVEGSPLSVDDRWIKGVVKIRLPKEGVQYKCEEDVPEFAVEDVTYRALVDVFTAAYQQPHVVRPNTELEWFPSPSALPSHFLVSSPPALISPFLVLILSFLVLSSSFTSAPSISSSPYIISLFIATSITIVVDTHEGIRVYSEVWHGDAWLEEDARMRTRPREAGDPSDLDQASLWPLYGYSLAQSKYVRGQPTSFAAHHLAYIPSLPDTLQDLYQAIYGVPASAAMLTFLKRELMQAVLLLLMDDRFMYAYVHGLVLLCGDEIMRRLFIRFLIHSADYPEKMLLTCLRFFARCPCPRCRINKDKIIEMGTRNDLYRRNWVRQDDTDTIYRIKITRRWVLEDGLALTSKYIARVLDPLSLTPTRARLSLQLTIDRDLLNISLSQSAYSIRLREHGFNVYSLFAPDLMHEFELGVWKSIWIHLLRILYAVGEDAIQRLNQRFRQTPPFGRSTIRRFSANISNQGKLAARDYEARLQCFMPAFENLLVGPASRRDNGIVLDLGFDLATWHCLAKLREHTEISLAGLDAKTVDVGATVRTFAKKTCGEYVTVELPSKDSAARGRRTAHLNKNKNVRKKGAAATEAKRKYFNYTTYKFHALRDYAPAIRAIAASNNFNTQVGELEHRHVKRFYARTNKIRAAFQIAQHMRRAETLRIIKRRVDAARASQEGAAMNATPTELVTGDELDRSTAAVPQEPLPFTADPLARYHIAESQRECDDLSLWVASQAADPAFQVQDFLSDLRNHILSRFNVALPPGEEDYTITDRSRIVFVKNRIYWHRVLRVNYTTYDRRRTQESINPRTHGDVLLLATNKSEGDHPYWYARIVKIFHVNARMLGAFDEEPKRIDVLTNF
ncbi:hypothetical protein ONZ51_g11242 [Trametes cubensis]|uniref:Uncharacterized protein n=1 Tax=Trametes cubensis TaxID=1111947 RepID=A0AAD7TI11_9APHY|nr:hypothetical protein ONZ51_g11242 [Trametes cubensis]